MGKGKWFLMIAGPSILTMLARITPLMGRGGGRMRRTAAPDRLQLGRVFQDAFDKARVSTRNTGPVGGLKRRAQQAQDLASGRKRGRPGMRRWLLGLAGVGAAAVLWREYPSMVRYLKVARM